MNIELIEKFGCNDPGRKYSKPYFSEGFTCVTNGHVFLKFPVVDGYGPNPAAPQLTRLASEFVAEPPEWYPCPDIPEIKGITCMVCDGKGFAYCCPECDGDGSVDLVTDYNHYGEEDCKTCDSYGCISRKEIDEIREFKKHVQAVEQTCNCCDGSGKEYAKDKSVSVGPADFSDRYLSWLNLFPNCEIGPIDSNKPARVRFDGGEGLIMPRRKD